MMLDNEFYCTPVGKDENYFMSEKYLNDLRHIYEENLKLLRKGIIPKRYPNGPMYRFVGEPQSLSKEIFKGSDWRSYFIKVQGFPLLSEDWVKPLAKWIGDRPCLEIMCGNGYLSYALSKYGCNIKATDNYSWNKEFEKMGSIYPVENLDCIAAIEKYGKNVKFIICSWPYMDSNAYRSLMKMREINPKCRMIYIGEEFGGCTANNDFFNNIEECYVKGFEDAVGNYRRWQSIHDSIVLVK